MKKNLFFLIFLFALNANVSAQKWSLKQCISYGLEHHIQLKQTELNARLTGLQLQQNKASKYPNFNVDVNNGMSVGRSIDPTSNAFINQAYYFNGFSASSNVLLFGWFAKKYQVEQSQFDVYANMEQYKQLQNDISLNIAAGYLRILLAKEQVKINEVQLNNDELQYKLTRKRVDAGQLPELNAAQLKSQVLNDSSTLVSSILDVNAAMLDLKAFLFLDMNESLDIEVPDISSFDFNTLLNYPNAQDIFEVAKTKRPNIEANNYKIKSASKQIEIANANKYPSVNLSASLGSNYASTVKSITGATYKGEEFLGNITILDSVIPVTRPAYNYITTPVPLFKQFGNNLRQTLVMGINIPIFNGYSTKLNIERAKINLNNIQLSQDQEIATLKQNVFKAYNDAQSAIQKMKAAKQSEDAAAIALDYAVKRYEAGMLNTQEYTNQQNALTRAKIMNLQSQYDLIFKIKILDFYLGKEIQL